jgi:hypothetical protein
MGEERLRRHSSNDMLLGNCIGFHVVVDEITNQWRMKLIIIFSAP